MGFRQPNPMAAKFVMYLLVGWVGFMLWRARTENASDQMRRAEQELRDREAAAAPASPAQAQVPEAAPMAESEPPPAASISRVSLEQQNLSRCPRMMVPVNAGAVMASADRALGAGGYGSVKSSDLTIELAHEPGDAHPQHAGAYLDDRDLPAGCAYTIMSLTQFCDAVLADPNLSGVVLHLPQQPVNVLSRSDVQAVRARTPDMDPEPFTMYVTSPQQRM